MKLKAKLIKYLDYSKNKTSPKICMFINEMIDSD